jgi:hypothetical protein
MTVKELIEKLKSFPDDALVLTEGYEDGYEPIKKIQLIKVEENLNKNWWDGKYLESKKQNAMEVVFLNAETKKDA